MRSAAWGLAQRLIAAITIVLLAPLLAALAVAVRLDSSGPVLYRSKRLGRLETFQILKFRTMRSTPGWSGPAVTALGDPRITRVGRFLRRTKLDELPQLWNVVRGQMLLVGPRPEDPRYADFGDPTHRFVFGARPGITGVTALAYRHEEALLADVAKRLAQAGGRDEPTRDDVERAYREAILPAKLVMDSEYLRTRSVRRDLAILWKTIREILSRSDVAR